MIKATRSGDVYFQLHLPSLFNWSPVTHRSSLNQRILPLVMSGKLPTFSPRKASFKPVISRIICLCRFI
ncbi:hypothetical protein CW304_13500 [Bacillus sp. UFRGS-B20]|nr:hypothetical protein CW304_13500 [Bacillus sp. UFRGS-B20]